MEKKMRLIFEDYTAKKIVFLQLKRLEINEKLTKVLDKPDYERTEALCLLYIQIVNELKETKKLLEKLKEEKGKEND